MLAHEPLQSSTCFCAVCLTVRTLGARRLRLVSAIRGVLLTLVVSGDDRPRILHHSTSSHPRGTTPYLMLSCRQPLVSAISVPRGSYHVVDTFHLGCMGILDPWPWILKARGWPTTSPSSLIEVAAVGTDFISAHRPLELDLLTSFHHCPLHRRRCEGLPYGLSSSFTVIRSFQIRSACWLVLAAVD